jgi:hypothetical protein
MMTLSRVVKDVLTEKDGESYDVTKVMWVIGTLVYFACTGWTVWAHPELGFNPVNWSIGFSTILAAGSAGVKIKESTEQSVMQTQLPPGDGKQ